MSDVVTEVFPREVGLQISAHVFLLNFITNQPTSCGKTSVTTSDIHLLNYI
jgi:hypothetical protein